MTRRVIGIEIELGASIAGHDGEEPAYQVASRALMDAAREHVVHLPDTSSGGIFMANGGRLYVDTGHHLEVCIPEVDSPDECVRFVDACKSIVADLARKVSRKLRKDVLIFTTNVDYWQYKTTWACHESFSHCADRASLPADLVPHFVSRLWCGAGGLNPLCAGIEFSMSPRLHIFETEISGNTTDRRGIFNTRDESLAGGAYQRLHVICGDTLCSQTSLWLRVGTTGLVLAMAEAGLKPGRAVRLRRPVQALHRFATDPYFKTTAELGDGRCVTALQIQRHYLEMAEANLEHDCMPEWAPEVCRRWRAMLDRLQQGPEAVELTLDWAIKYAIFQEHLREEGLDPALLPHWNKVLTRLQTLLRKKQLGERLSADLIIGRNGPLRDEVKRLEPKLTAHGLAWEQVPQVLRLRSELCETDLHFGQLHPKGIFATLEPQLEHRIPGIGAIDRAKTTPPQRTRARLRGEAIRRLAGRQNCSASWTYVQDDKGRRLDLSGPLCLDAHWSDGARREPAMGLTRREVSFHYNRGDLNLMLAITERARRSRAVIGPDGVGHFMPYVAWAKSRRGELARALAILDELTATGGNPNSLVWEYVAVYRFQALVPSRPEIWTWIRLGDELLAGGLRSQCTRAAHLGHKGYVLARSGPLREAERVLRSACGCRDLGGNHARVEARNMTDLADVLRILGQHDEAARWLDEAATIHACHDYPGDKADHLLTVQAKLERDPARARSHLRSAKRIQTRFSNHVGLVRTLLLEARLSKTRRAADRRKEQVLDLREQVPDLRSCPLLARILDRWPQWANSCQAVDPVTEHGDSFWLL